MMLTPNREIMFTDDMLGQLQCEPTPSIPWIPAGGISVGEPWSLLPSACCGLASDETPFDAEGTHPCTHVLSLSLSLSLSTSLSLFISLALPSLSHSLYVSRSRSRKHSFYLSISLSLSISLYLYLSLYLYISPSLFLSLYTSDT